MAIAIDDRATGESDGWSARFDGFKAHAEEAAAAFRALDQEAIERIVWAITVAGHEPRSLAEAGVARPEFDAALPDLARAALMDPRIRTNPRVPMVKEIIELLQAEYER